MSLWHELKRRNVLKVGAAYAVVAWLLVQVAATLSPQLGLPEWAPRLVTLLLMLGFPITLLLAWFLDHTPEGIRVEPAATGNKRIVGVALALAVVACGWYLRDARDARQASAQATKDAATAAAADQVAATAATKDGPASIAVLPFTNLGGKEGDEYFSDGMTEELLNVLARNTKLRVAARTSTFQFKDKGVDVREVGRTLGVDHIVEGSVRRDGGQVRITAQLIRVADGFHVWSESFDREITSVFALQDEIAQRLAEQLGSTLASGDRPVAGREDVDPAAYDDFLKARALYRERRSSLTAIELFRGALAREPRFAAAWANLALACEVAVYYATPAQSLLVGDRLACMREAVGHATETAPDAAITLHAQGSLARSEGRLLDAEQLFRASMARDATYPDVREDLSELLAGAGHTEAAVAEVRELLALEPGNPLFVNRLAMIGSMTDDASLLDEAVGPSGRSESTSFWLQTSKFRHALCHGRLPEASAALERTYAKTPDAVAALLVLFRWSQRDAGIDPQFGRELLRSTYWVDGPPLAAAFGDPDLFFEVLADPRLRDKRFDGFRHLACPIAAGMLVDPRAKGFLREAGFEAYWRANGWPPQCRPAGDTDFECSPAPFARIANRGAAS